MWLYIIAGVLIVVVIILLVVFYKGYTKIKPDPLKGIPCPPLSHSIFGHPERMLHPLKHELRLEVTEQARGPLHQLVLMKHSSIFINDANEAAAVLSEFHAKGKMYGAFRFDTSIPDMLASEGNAHELRRKSLSPALANMRLLDDTILGSLVKKLIECSESGKALDMEKMSALFAMDCVCKAAFGYDLQAINGSEDGSALYRSICTLQESFASQGIYPSPTARKVPPEELEIAKSAWKSFLLKLVEHVKTEGASCGGEFDTQNNVAHSLMKLYNDANNSSDVDTKFGEAEMLSEIHQILRHGYETIGGMVQWITYVLYHFKKVRENLEKAILDHQVTASQPYPPYLECVLKETFRRYPVTGNMTVRTPTEEGGQLAGGIAAPVGVPIHVPIFSLQNTTREWYKPKEFVPERWLEEAPDERDHQNIAANSFCHPKCPFVKAMNGKNSVASGTASKDDDVMYSGVGFKEDYLSFFPFSVGVRGCPAKGLVLNILRSFLMTIASQFHLDPVKSVTEDDIGKSLHAIILPLSPNGMSLSVKRITSLQLLVNKDAGALIGGAIEVTVDTDGTSKSVAADDGWADDDDDDEEVPELVEPKDKNQ